MHKHVENKALVFLTYDYRQQPLSVAVNSYVSRSMCRQCEVVEEMQKLRAQIRNQAILGHVPPSYGDYGRCRSFYYRSINFEQFETSFCIDKVIAGFGAVPESMCLADEEPSRGHARGQGANFLQLSRSSLT